MTAREIKCEASDVVVAEEKKNVLRIVIHTKILLLVWKKNHIFID